MHTKRKPNLPTISPMDCIELPLWLLPDLSWFQQAVVAKTVVVNDLQLFEKQSPLSRYAIGAPNTTQWLSVPINHNSRGLPLTETRINYQQNWIKDHKQAWQTAYGKTPFFEFYDYKFFQLWDAHFETLAQLSWELLCLLHSSLQLPNTLIRKSTLDHPIPANDSKKLADFILSADSNKTEDQNFFQVPYNQVFQQKHGFRYPLSAIDYLFQNYPKF